MKKGESTYKNKEWLTEQCVSLKKPDRQIALSLGIDPKTISYWRNKHGVACAMKDLPSREELVSLYTVEKKTDVEIAEMFDLGQTTICRMRKQFGINANMIGGSKPLKMLLSKDELRNLYINMEMSDEQIGDHIGASKYVVYWWRKKHGILARDLSLAHHLRTGNSVVLSEEAKDFICGELLGDGHLFESSKHSAGYMHSSKYKEYVQWLSSRFNDLGIEQVGKINRYDDGKAISYHYCSRSYPELMKIRKEWYPYGEKIIPKSLVITPMVMLHHYIGDGALKKNPRGGSSINLHTDGFEKRDVFFLRELLKNIGINTNYHKSNNTIYIPVSATKDFISYIGNCPEEIEGVYGYKWAVK